MSEQQHITRSEVEHVAKLARLNFTESELDELTSQLTAVLAHAADVDALDLSTLEPTVHPLPLANIAREDAVRPSLDRDEVLSQAPAVDDLLFKAPPLLEGS